MLLLHQVGSVKVGEVVRYTVTYTPSQDRILPSPEKLYVRIRNTSTIALRAAFVHGPYTLSVSAYPSNYNPNEKYPDPRRYGVPEFEPMLKAGGSWDCELVVPHDIRQAAGVGRHAAFGKSHDHDHECASWIIEIASQVIFSTSAAVGFELVVARDHKSLNLSQSLPIVGNASAVPQPGRVSDYQESIGAKDGHHPAQTKGVFSRAVHLKVEDTASLWNTPRLPGWDDVSKEKGKAAAADKPVQSMVQTPDPGSHKCKSCVVGERKKKKKVHLVILTHGLHSNLGADMLYIKESIDVAARQARIDAKARRAKERAAKREASTEPRFEDAKQGDDDDEEVIVRGYPGNATKTEKGIKYLGKRLSRYILSMTYPDQPFLPTGKGAVWGPAESMKGDHSHRHHGSPDAKASQNNSTIQAHVAKAKQDVYCRHYNITSISFVGHSLGGLIQTYAIAYIQKHSPDFFNLIKPVNFIALASPFLGLSNENPLYVKFALDFGLVGRTGQDLGLTWRAPTIARSGWGAIVSNLGESAHKKVYGEAQAESKPLLRILPTGPAHVALKKFRNRTVYSNVVNDGIVPLRTSCLLFLDWQGLGRVEKARRDAGLVETVVGFGWAELTGTSMLTPRQKQRLASDEQTQHSDSGTSTPIGSMRQVPQPSDDAMDEDDRASIRSVPRTFNGDDDSPSDTGVDAAQAPPLAGFFNFFKSNEPPRPKVTSAKQKKILRRGQTIPINGCDTAYSTTTTTTTTITTTTDRSDRKPGKATTGHEMEEEVDGMTAPPKTTFFESAGDLLNPSLPSKEYLLDPSKRPRTIFHDRVYHPSDIPPPPMKKRPSTLTRRRTSGKMSATSQRSTQSDSSSPHPSINHADSMEPSARDQDDSVNSKPDTYRVEVVDGSSMRVEEKIARGYHRDLSWRKVLVELEPDAHNNIIVRRMFANAHGWPVVKHLVDAHFSDSEAARMRDDEEPNVERAFASQRSPDADGREVKQLGQLGQEGEGNPESSEEPSDSGTSEAREAREAREALDEVPELRTKSDGDLLPLPPPRLGSSDRADSMTWSERDWVDSEDESDVEAHKEKQRQQSTQPTKGGAQQERLSPSSSWKWAEKIVGKGSTRSRRESPKPGEGR
ncbi:uncharacterized protein MAM_03807 [Metarhizium album ARSEF 1941]|uniref:DUF676 domain-containing protein n=1 Tax=Metarhizium album (strain ARSEF 1941) TaxID=1081103 RepID=A0A0B2WPS6_METAS|nr:uncharacterized protein MAM_03807 [Metarhizium album ARSEF 1941]KHN98046.1 hypothetical protein MAM_03807 [Metarhizium album ARSEF 1941]